MTSDVNRVAFGWWNTGLSPQKGKQAPKDTVQFAANVISWLMEELLLDCLALGEVLKEDLDQFVKHISTRAVDYHLGEDESKTGRLRLAVMYDTARLNVVGAEDFISRSAGSSFRAGREFVFQIHGMDKPLHVLTSHWNSRLYAPRGDSARIKLGITLRDRVEELVEQYDEDPLVVLMGDYNDEPFDEPLAEFLLASRDPELVHQKADLLYNPFWRRLGAEGPHEPGNRNSGPAGTYFHAKGTKTRWYTFDQMIFSRAFLGTSEWELNEKLVRIVDLPQIFGGDAALLKTFDHLPIVGVIEKTVEGDVTDG